MKSNGIRLLILSSILGLSSSQAFAEELKPQEPSRSIATVDDLYADEANDPNQKVDEYGDPIEEQNLALKEQEAFLAPEDQIESDAIEQKQKAPEKQAKQAVHWRKIVSDFTATKDQLKIFPKTKSINLGLGADDQKAEKRFEKLMDVVQLRSQKEWDQLANNPFETEDFGKK